MRRRKLVTMFFAAAAAWPVAAQAQNYPSRAIVMVVRPSPLAPNYDPDVFPDPLRFDVRRKPKRILSFGAGPHHCIGNILGRTAITIAVTRLLARFPDAHIREPGFTPVYGGAVGELRLQSLPMRIQ